MLDWLVVHKEEIGLVALGVVSGAVAALRFIAPLTKNTVDDKVLGLGKRVLAALARWVSPKE